MRITSSFMYNSFRRNLERTTAELFETQEVMATQRVINRVSDDPVSAGIVRDTTSNKSAAEQFLRNIGRSKSMTSLSDIALDQTNELFSRAKELMLSQANTATSTAATREAVAIELVSLRSQLVSVANTRLGSRYIFAGTNDTVMPFTPTAVTVAPGAPNSLNATATAEIANESALTGDNYDIVFTATGYDIINTTRGVTVSTDNVYTSDTDINFEGVLVRITDNPGAPAIGDVFSVSTVMPGLYNGNSREIKVDIEEGARVALNVPGDRVFHGVGLTGGINLFDVFTGAIDALRDNDTVAIDASLDRLDGSVEQISEQRSALGARENLYLSTERRLGQLTVNLDILRSQMQDVDLADAATEFVQRETAFNAALSVTSRISSISLLEFLR